MLSMLSTIHSTAFCSTPGTILAFRIASQLMKRKRSPAIQANTMI